MTITAYNSSNTAVGSTTSYSFVCTAAGVPDASCTGPGAPALGSFTFTPTGSGPYRLEFTTLPTGYTPSAAGTNNGTSVLFVANGGATGLDFGLVYASDYGQNDPEVVTNCYVYGNQASTSSPNVADNPVIVSFPYSAGSTDLAPDSLLAQYDAPAKHLVGVPAKNVGTTFGLAYARQTRRIYAAAFFKRHAGFGKGADGTIDTSNGSGTGDDAGAIYEVSRDTSAVLRTFTVPNAPTNKHNTSDYSRDNSNAGWDGVGKSALGGMDISADETTLYVMNLEDRKLYAMNISAGTFTNVAVPTTTVPLTAVAANYGTATKAAAGDVRPFAVRYYRGLIYIGLICTGESTGLASDLYAHVYTVTPSTLTFSTNPVFSARLNYTRGVANATGQAEWLAWKATYSNVNSQAQRTTYPQPMFTDLVFENGNMIIGLRDRTGDQVGNNTKSNPADEGTGTGGTLYQPRDAGDVLRACGSVAAGWTLESNGRCGGSGSGPQDSGQGPGATTPTATGSAEFYYGDAYTYTFGGVEGVGSNHDEVALGTMAQLPGALETLFMMWDPIPNRTAPLDTIHDGGARWLYSSGASAGKILRSFRLYDGSSNTTDLITFGKAAGLGEVDLMFDPAPLQLGNRVWNDANANGIQDAGESGIANVVVELYSGATKIGSATTDSSGNYYFGGAANVNMLSNPSCTGNTYARRIAAYTDDAEQVGTTVTTTTTASSPMTLGRDPSNANTTAGLRFSGVQVPKGATITSATLVFTPDATPGSGTVTVNIDGEAADNAATYSTASSNISSRTLTSAGNRVSWSVGTWTASTANANSTTPDLKNIVQEIINRSGWQTGNAVNFIISNNGTTGTNSRNAQVLETGDTNNPASDTQANAAGNTALLMITYTCPYTLAPSTSYEIRIASANFNSGQPLNGYALTNQNADSTTNGDVRDTDATYANGLPLISVTTGAYGDHNHTYDFGFENTASVTTVSLGNRVWNDVNNNGTLDVGETGLANVVVNLYNSAGTTLLGTTTTDTNGYYSFPGLTSGTAYLVELAASNFNSGGALDGYRSSLSQPNGTETTAPNPNSNSSDTDDNGQTSGTLGSGGVIRAQAVTVTAGSAPTGETNGAGDTNLDNRANLTVDFGLYLAYTVGNRVWRDNGNGGGTADNGIRDGSEAGISGVTVAIYADNNSDGVADGTALATVTTDSSGYYRFDGLVAGKYVVGIPASNFGAGQPLQNLYSTLTSVTSSSNSTDSRDNGVNNGTPNLNGIFSGTFNLAAKTIPTSESDNQTPGSYGSGATVNGPAASDSRGDLTIDFGFTVTAALAVHLTDFSAQTSDGFGLAQRLTRPHGVTVRWSTGYEVGNLGFNLYRDESGRQVKLNPSLIAGSALLSRGTTQLTAGNSYAWHDAYGAAGTAYWLEEVTLDGDCIMHGPATALTAANHEPQVMQRAALLEELNSAANRSIQTEFAASPGSAPLRAEAVSAITPQARSPLGVLADKPNAAWTLPGQTAVKLLVRQAGWYRLSAADLSAAGLDAKTNANFLQLWADGVEVPLTVNRSGGRLDSIEFYGTGADTPATDTRVYWLGAVAPNGRRTDVLNAPLADRSNTASFRSSVERKDRLIYFSGLLNGDAENWFGPIISGTPATQSLFLRNLAPDNGQPATLDLVLQGVTEAPHSVYVELNGRALGTLTFANREHFSAKLQVPAAWLNAGENAVKLSTPGGSDFSLVDTVRLTYPRTFRASDDALNFSLQAGETATLSGFSTAQLRLLQLRADGPHELLVKGLAQPDGSFGFTLAGDGSTYFAQTDARFARVAGTVVNQPSDWRARTNAADFVIVTHRAFWAAANQLAAARQAAGLRVAVVDVEDAYDEFSFGLKSPQAVKDLLTYARTNWTRKPAFALLIGSATNDPRNYLGLGDADFVPTKLGATYYFETALDNWFADTDNNSLPELALGRLPVRSAVQANALVSKILAFKVPATPRNNLFVSDRVVEGVNFQALSQMLAAQLPAALPKQFFNRDDAPPDQLRTRIIDAINQSTPLIVNWLGHGSVQVWTGDGLLRAQDAPLLTNAGTSLFVMTTCLNGYFTDPVQRSLSEAVLLDTPGGAFGAIASSGLNDAASQNVFNLTLYQNLFGKGLTLGEAMTAARLACGDVDVRNTYVLFGDPTLRVSAQR